MRSVWLQRLILLDPLDLGAVRPIEEVTIWLRDSVATPVSGFNVPGQVKIVIMLFVDEPPDGSSVYEVDDVRKHAQYSFSAFVNRSVVPGSEVHAVRWVAGKNLEGEWTGGRYDPRRDKIYTEETVPDYFRAGPQYTEMANLKRWIWGTEARYIRVQVDPADPTMFSCPGTLCSRGRSAKGDGSSESKPSLSIAPASWPLRG